MKFNSLILISLLAVGTAFAVLTSKFTNWNDLTDRSRDIVVCRCTVVPSASQHGKPTVVIDGILRSDIDVISVLKGSTQPGLSHMASQYCPYQGEQFLLFANYRNDQFYTGYNAVESYRIVPISNGFDTNELGGKSLKEQIQVILDRRLAEINAELQRDNEEKQRIEGGLKVK